MRLCKHNKRLGKCALCLTGEIWHSVGKKKKRHAFLVFGLCANHAAAYCIFHERIIYKEFTSQKKYKGKGSAAIVFEPGLSSLKEISII